MEPQWTQNHSRFQAGCNNWKQSNGQCAIFRRWALNGPAENDQKQIMNPKSPIKSGCLLASAASMLLVASTQADTPAFVLSSVSTNPPSSFTGTRGWEFAPRDDVLITQLGVFDSGTDGLINFHQIGLWRRDPGGLTGTLLASATVPAGTDAPLIGGYRWVSIPPVHLSIGLAFYAVGAHYSAADADALFTPSPSQFASGIGLVLANGKLAFGPDLAFPAAYTGPPCEGCLGERFFEPNLQYVVVPEPSSWLLLSSALVFLFLRYRHRNHSGKD